MSNKMVIYTKSEGVATIKLNSPKTMNALTGDLVDELKVTIQDAATDESIGAVILTGTDKAFCAGGDLQRLSQGFTPVEAFEYLKGFTWVSDLVNMEKPVIAAVNGFAVGAGFTLAMMCDLVMASQNAKFGLAFVNVGLVPDLGASYFLTRTLGLQRTKELAFTGRNMDADEAYRIGVATMVVPPESLEEEALKLAKKLANGPRVAIRTGKRLINRAVDLGFEELLDLEAFSQAQCFQTEDSKIAMEAFFNKTKPVFKGK